jgi:hypothetical protein
MSNFLDDTLNQSVFFDIIYSKMMKSFLTSMLATKIKTSAVKPTFGVIIADILLVVSSKVYTRQT